jgi:hypothetical protein
MTKYRVLAYRTATFAKYVDSPKVLLGVVELSSDSPSGALVAAERQLEDALLKADRIEVVRTAPSPALKP